jgi:uncharacterized membrane protein YdbT with pleckstrin-like domain
MEKAVFYTSPKKYFILLFFAWLVVFILLLGLSTIFDLPLFLYLFAILMAFASFAFAYFYTRMIRIEVDDHGVVFYTGLLVRNKTTVPFSRIDNTKIIQSVSDMVLGLGSLEIDTPGKSGPEIVIKNFEMKDINTIYSIIKEHTGKKT